MKKTLMAAAGRNYYIAWTLLYSAGVYAGIKIPYWIGIPAYAGYMIIVLMFLLLAGASIFYIRNQERKWGKAPCSRLALLVIIPSVILFFCGYLTASPLKGLPENCESGPAVFPEEVRLQGRVLDHPETVYGTVYMEVAITGSSSQVLQKGDVISVMVKNRNREVINRDDLVEAEGELRLSGGTPELRAGDIEAGPLEQNELSSMIFGLRQRSCRCISGAFSHYLDSRHAALARALILGDRRGLKERTYDIFRQSGTAHLLAISGLHISFLAAMIYMILKKVLTGYILITILALVLLAYNFLLGPGASIMRATIWVLGTAAAAAWNRKFSREYVLCISFMLISISNPSFLKAAGFWLSFAAMAGIVFVYPSAKGMLIALKLPKRVLDNHITVSILMTFSIQLACGPLLLYYFGSLPLISPLSNLVILSFFYILILLLFFASALCILWPPAGGAVLRLVPTAAKPVLGIAGFFSRDFFPSLEMESPGERGLFLYYLAILIIFSVIKIIAAKRFDF
jgi:ComEC/Rec2-related protein